MLINTIAVLLLIFSAEAITVKSELKTRPAVNYPVRSAYIDKVLAWWPPDSIAAGMGVPSYAAPHEYNYLILAFWSCSSGNLDMVNVWGNPVYYFGDTSQFGATNDAIQKSLKTLYNNAGISIMVSAFGATEFPTTAGEDPTTCANSLADFVLKNNLDGVDIDWEDNTAMDSGTGEQWLITFTTILRNQLPGYIISHAPQAPYFCKEYYVNGAYWTVDNKVGDLIDFYNIQFYNQGANRYDTYTTLFVTSGGPFNGTSVSEIVARGVPSKKLVVGKPVTQGDASNTGVINLATLGSALTQGYKDYKWYAGAMFWQYPSDSSGAGISTVISGLKSACATGPTACV